MAHPKPDIPFGICVIQKCFPSTVITSHKHAWSRGFILLLTFIIYTCYHASRKPLSVVKSVLHPNCSALTPPSNISSNDTEWCDWKPFNKPDANSLFGLLDSSFLFSYAFAMFCSGFIAERMNLRYFLAIGTCLSGVSVYLLGLAKVYDIHSLWYFMAVQAFGGVFQTAGWPGVVTVMGNWYGKGKTGFIFGVWNSHTSMGNILGTLVAGYFVEDDWSLSFIVLGVIMIVLSIVIFLFLVSEPTTARNQAPETTIIVDDSDDQSDTTESSESEHRTQMEQRPILTQRNEVQPIGFVDAMKIPGVVEFSICLFFAKLVSYTFLYWLPMYIHASTTMGAEISAILSTLFDIGGIIGGILAGAISDYIDMQAFTCGAMLVYAVPVLYIYYLYGGYCLYLNIGLLFLTGALVNGPYALITTAVSAKLGMDTTLSENTKALSTVTAIIDGTGSIGAATGPLIAGFVSDYLGWEYVFFTLMISDVLAFCMLLRLIRNELKRYSRTHSHGWTS